MWVDEVKCNVFKNLFEFERSVTQDKHTYMYVYTYVHT